MLSSFFVFIGHLSFFFFKTYISFENCLFNEFAHRLTGLFVLLMLKSCFYFLYADIYSCLHVSWQVDILSCSLLYYLKASFVLLFSSLFTNNIITWHQYLFLSNYWKNTSTGPKMEITRHVTSVFGSNQTLTVWTTVKKRRIKYEVLERHCWKSWQKARNNIHLMF